MIKNFKQHRAALDAIKHYKADLEKISREDNIDPIFKEVTLSGYKEMIRGLESQVAEYERTKVPDDEVCQFVDSYIEEEGLSRSTMVKQLRAAMIVTAQRYSANENADIIKKGLSVAHDNIGLLFKRSTDLAASVVELRKGAQEVRDLSRIVDKLNNSIVEMRKDFTRINGAAIDIDKRLKSVEDKGLRLKADILGLQQARQTKKKTAVKKTAIKKKR